MAAYWLSLIVLAVAAPVESPVGALRHGGIPAQANVSPDDLATVFMPLRMMQLHSDFAWSHCADGDYVACIPHDDLCAWTPCIDGDNATGASCGDQSAWSPCRDGDYFARALHDFQFAWSSCIDGDNVACVTCGVQPAWTHCNDGDSVACVTCGVQLAWTHCKDSDYVACDQHDVMLAWPTCVEGGYEACIPQGAPMIALMANAWMVQLCGCAWDPCRDPVDFGDYGACVAMCPILENGTLSLNLQHSSWGMVSFHGTSTEVCDLFVHACVGPSLIEQLCEPFPVLM
eukprot:6458798-Amphidinium_carterae.1